MRYESLIELRESTLKSEPKREKVGWLLGKEGRSLI